MGGGVLSACDHDYIQMHVTPSVVLKMTPPRSVAQSFYGGAPFMILKDAIFEASSAMRHMSELKKTHSEEDRGKSVHLFYTDGGGDHRTPFISVQKSYIAYFIEMDLDFLGGLRTPPYYSVLNPAERLNTCANGGLYGMTLARKEMSPETEKRIKNISSKKKWRNLQQDFEQGKEGAIDYSDIVKDSTKNCIDALKQRLESLIYKGNHIKVLKPSSKQEIRQTFESLDRIDSAFDWKDKKINKDKIMERTNVSDFYKKHVKVTQYAFQVKKCLDLNCKYHKPVRMDADTFQKIKWIPMPTPTEGDEKYKDFDNAYSETEIELTDKYRPGRNKDNKNENSEKPEKPPPGFYMGIDSGRHALFCE